MTATADRHEVADADLVLAVQSGNERAFELIWARYSSRVSGFLARSGGCSPHDVEDLTQEVFLQVFASSRRIRKPAALRYYVMTVASRVFKRQLRSWRSSRLVRLTKTGELPDLVMVPGADEDIRAIRHALRRCLEVLSRIHAREQVAFISHYLEQMTVEEIAERLGISTSTVKRLNARALKKVTTRGPLGRYRAPNGVRRATLTAASSR